MRKLFTIPALLLGMLALAGTQAFAQSATVLMRSGDRVNAEIIDMGADFTFRINGQNRHIPIADVALIDFTGNGTNLPQDEINRVSNQGPIIVLKNGEVIQGSLTDIMGKPSQAEISHGRRVDLSGVARIYVSGVQGISGVTAAQAPAATAAQPAGSRTVVVPSNSAWVDTGIPVRKGQRFRFVSSGDARLSSSADDVATPAGAASYRFSPRAPIPTIPVGALIGRVGNGAPFSIGKTDDAFTMPDNGRLFLGINDDNVSDNTGNYTVYVSQ